MDNLNGRVALVTGGSRGIGRAIAVALAGAGCDVAVSYRERQTYAESSAAEIANAGRRSMIFQADVSKNADVRALAEAVEARLGPIDILVNNAGAIRIQKPEEISEDDWNEMIAVNLTSCFLMTQAVLSGMRARRWGRVINLSSVAGQAGSVFGLHYAAAKAGMIGLSRSYARVLAKEGITVNVISPALVATEMVTANPLIKPDLIPMGRFGEIGEVADVAVMLAGNAFITGQTVGVNGGLHLG
jgi:3-oxoacyl-[acyl-carrier protein] reductase